MIIRERKRFEAVAVKPWEEVERCDGKKADERRLRNEPKVRRDRGNFPG